MPQTARLCGANEVQRSLRSNERLVLIFYCHVMFSFLSLMAQSRKYKFINVW